MLDRFQNLPTPLRVFLFVLFIGAVIGLVAILAYFSNGGPQSTPPESPQPSVTGGSSAPTAKPSPSASFDPNNLGPNNLAPTESTTDIYGKNRKFTDSQMNAAVAVAQKAEIAFCRYTPSQSASQWVDNLRPYYQAADFPYSESDYITLIKTQQCSITNIKPQSQNSSGELVVGIAAQQATIYQAGAPIVPNGGKSGNAAYYYPVGGTATMKLVAGKWYVASLDVKQQGN